MKKSALSQFRKFAEAVEHLKKAYLGEFKKLWGKS